jgi:cytochrome c553
MKHEGDNRRFPQAFTIYEGGLLGASYEGFIIAPNALHNVVYASQLIPANGTFRTKDHADIVTSTDRWFRPVDGKSGPDGCIYMADWSDTRLSHVSPVDDWHKGSGRVYRIRPATGAPLRKTPDLHQCSARELLQALQDPNEWTRKQAAMEAGWRHLDELIPPLTEIALDDGHARAIDALFALDQMGAVADELNIKLLSHAEPYVRRWATRMLGEPRSISIAASAALVKLATQEPHIEVLTQLAATAKRLPTAHTAALISALVKNRQSKEERLNLMLWWALESIATRDASQAVALFADPALWEHAVLVKNLTQRLALPGGEANLQYLAALMLHGPSMEHEGIVLDGLAATLDGGELPPMPEVLSKGLKGRLKALAGDDLALGIRSGDAKAKATALAKLKDKAVPTSIRAGLALAFAEQRDQPAYAVLESVYKASGQEPLKRALLPAVAKYADHKIIRLMLDSWERMMAGDRSLREAALRTMAGRVDWAKLALAEVDRWQVPTKHFTPDVLRQMSLLADATVTASIEKHWPGILSAAPTADTEKEAQRITQVLSTAPGDAAKGKTHFTARCATCHKLFGEGAEVAPELTGYDRGSLEFWLGNILTPSLEIREG